MSRIIDCDWLIFTNATTYDYIYANIERALVNAQSQRKRMLCQSLRQTFVISAVTFVDIENSISLTESDIII